MSNSAFEDGAARLAVTRVVFTPVLLGQYVWVIASFQLLWVLRHLVMSCLTPPKI
jgi:hypothetical protein